MAAYYFEQFTVVRIIDIAGISNSSIGMIMGLIISGLYIRSKRVIPGRWQIMVEGLYGGIIKIVEENIGSGREKYMVKIMGIVMMIGIINIMGLMPYVYTPTSQIVITMGLSVSIIIGVTIIGFKDKGVDNISQMMPMGAPIIIGPFMVIVETISYISRGISLGVRLAANISAGHLLYAIITGFTIEMIEGGYIISGMLPLIIMVGVVLLEVGVAMIQAYVYGLLTAIYIGEAVDYH